MQTRAKKTNITDVLLMAISIKLQQWSAASAVARSKCTSNVVVENTPISGGGTCALCSFVHVYAMRSHTIYRICEEMHICTYTNKLFHTHVYIYYLTYIPRGIRIYTVIERRGRS